MSDVRDHCSVDGGCIETNLGSELIKHEYDDKYQCYPNVIVIMMGKQTALV